MPSPYNTLTPEQIKAERRDDLLLDAANLVAKLAPPPDPDNPDADAVYVERAARCERRLYRYFDETGNTTSSGVGSISESFKDMKESRRIVREVMGSYYTGSTTGIPIV